MYFQAPVLHLFASLLCLVPASLAVITCNPPPPAGRHWSNPPPLPDDCARVADIILAGDKSHAPMHFSHQPGKGFLVPHRWVMGTCVVEIDTVKRSDEDDFPISKIGLTVSAIATACVVDGPGYGGVDFAGPKKVLFVRVHGRNAPGSTLADMAGTGNSPSSLPGANNETLSRPLQGDGIAVARDSRS